MQVIKFTRWRGARNPEGGTFHELSWPDFCRQLTALGQRNKHPTVKTAKGEVHSLDYPCWCPAAFVDGYRDLEHLVEVYAIGLDFDRGSPSYDDLAAALTAKGWLFFLYTTKSHTPEHHTLRAVLPFAEPIGLDDFRSVRSELAELFPGQTDENAKDACRLWWEPTIPASGVFRSHGGGFKALDGRGMASVRRRYDDEMKRRELEAPPDEPVPDPPKAYTVKQVERANKLLTSMAGKVGLSPQGKRDATLRKSAAILGGKPQAMAILGRERVHKTLVDAAMHAGLSREEAEDKTARALDWGMEHPLDDLPVERQEKDGLRLKDRDDAGKPKATLINTAEVLEKAPALQGLISFDEFSQDIAFSGPVPGALGADVGPHTLRDVDVVELRVWIGATYGFEPGKDVAYDALTRAARLHSSHPVREYLNGLTWDGTPRIARLLPDYFGCAPTPDGPNGLARLEIAARVMLLSAIARVMKPGCRSDVSVVLHGPQGYGKSSCVAALCGVPWFLQTAMDLRNKDSMLLLRGNWFVELAELSAIRAKDVEMVKDFMSRSVDEYRAPYDRTTARWPRQCVFVGTSNDMQPYTDRTGNRRFYSVCVTERALASKIERDRDQLWAEALHFYRAGVPWWLSVEEEEAAAAVQEQFSADSGDESWTSIVRRYLDVPTRNEVTAHELLTQALLFEPARISRADETRLGVVMRSIHEWSRVQATSCGRRSWVYRRAAPPLR